MLRTASRAGFVAGLLATIALVGLLRLATALVQLPFIPYDLADLIIRVTPGQIATQGIEALGPLAKVLIKLAAIVAIVGWGGALGALAGRRVATERFAAQNHASLAMAGTLLTVALLNHQPSRPSVLQFAPMVTLLVLVWLWGVALGYLLDALSPSAGEEPELDGERRTFLIRSGATVVTLAIGSTALAELFSQDANAARVSFTLPEPSMRATEQAIDTGGFIAPEGVRTQITPQSKLYYVSSRIRDPRVDAESYRLIIDGLVDQPLSLTLDQIYNLPRVDQTSTLQCISNEVGGELIGNCRWNGTRLADLLEQAGIRSRAQRVVLYAADGYADSIAVEDALRPETLIVYGVDDEPLTVPHGYPVRLIVPNIYGMKNVKWLQRIEVVDYDFEGFWQERGWSQPAIVKTTSVIDTRGNQRLENGVVPLGGIAFAGSRGIERVEVRIDEGEWQAATLEPVSNDLQWQRWRYDWAATPGRRTVAVRAVDGAGEVQTHLPAPPHPDGASGYHRVRVEVQG